MGSCNFCLLTEVFHGSRAARDKHENTSVLHTAVEIAGRRKVPLSRAVRAQIRDDTGRGRVRKLDWNIHAAVKLLWVGDDGWNDAAAK